MIRLQKEPVPSALQQKIAQRTQQYLQLVADGLVIPESLASAYRDPEVKQLLRKETANKCAYCESKIPHVDYGDVEHIVPKTASPERRFDYSNLTYACGVCNTKKGSYYELEAPLLNPYVDEPEEHLFAAGPMVMRKANSDRGLVTQKKLDLNRLDLIERRTERLEAIGALMDQIARTTNPAVIAVLNEQVRQECASDKEYAFVIRSFVQFTHVTEKPIE